MSIQINHVSKRFGTFQALDRIDLEIKAGTLVALLGPSGSGKSTLLRAIAGLEPPDTGTIFINGQDTTHLDVRRRNIGFVFQHYALFKHMTVRQNIAFGLEIRRVSRHTIQQRVKELLELVQLEGFGDRYPAQLSGGQRQRVALARALAVQPQVLLLDEPFGALDAKVRKELRAWVRRLHDEVHLTSVFVTHDREEAMELADEIVVMHHGRIEQVGTPAHVYEHPATPFVMSFVGEVNVLRATLPIFEDTLAPHQQEAFVRPHDIDILLQPSTTAIAATVRRINYLGSEMWVELLLPDGQAIEAHLSRSQWACLDLLPGQHVFVQPKNVKSFTAAA